jgi:hypothetical protein
VLMTVEGWAQASGNEIVNDRTRLTTSVTM